MNTKQIKIPHFIIIICLTMLLASGANAAYTVSQDVINGGGQTGTSSNYMLLDSVWQPSYPEILASDSDYYLMEGFLNVINVNSPTITPIPDQITDDAMPVGPVSFTVSDRETHDADLIVTATSSDTTLVSDTNILIAGSGSNRTITLTPTQEMTGQTIITLTVDDTQGKTAQTSFILAVTSGPVITGIMSAELLTDADGDNAVSPGDTLRYTVAISNTGDRDAEGVIFSGNPPDHTTLVENSVSTESGTIASEDPISIINIAVSANESQNIWFDVVIDTGILTGQTISTYGIISYDVNGDDLPDITWQTDGDTSVAGNQTTDITIGGTPRSIAVLTVTDLNGGNTEAGDELQYTVVITNQSNYDIPGIRYLQNIPENTEYVPYSLSAPQSSTIISETPVIEVISIEVPAQSQVSILFRVKVKNPLSSSVTQIAAQGTFYYDTDGDGINDSEQKTDNSTSANQPTVIALSARPNFSETTKTVSLYLDADMNDAISPEDTLEYVITIPNTGTQDAVGVEFADDISDSVNLQGFQNLEGLEYNSNEKRLEWSGDIPAGETITITFRVLVGIHLSLGDMIQNQGTVSYDSNNDGKNDATEETDGDSSEPGNQSTDVAIGGGIIRITAVKTVKNPQGFQNPEGFVNPGGELEYTITLKNDSGYYARNIEIEDVIPTHTRFVEGSASVPQGCKAVHENGVLKITNITLEGYDTTTFSFRVSVNDLLSAGVTEISNQGTILYDSDGDETKDETFLTDGDAEEAGEQPTLIPTAGEPDFGTAVMSIELESDNDGNDGASPGDALVVTALIPNTGNQNATGVVFADYIPEGTSYVQGSAEASFGSISYDATANQIKWIGNVASGKIVEIIFEVTIDDDLNAGDLISTQGTISYDSDADGTNDAIEQTNQAEITIPKILIATGTASSVGYTSATLTGTVNPAGETTTYYFEYGTSEDYGFTTEKRSAGEGYDNFYVSLTANGLEEGTTYHYRLVVVRNGSASYGEDSAFTTKSGGIASGEGIYKDDSIILNWATGWLEPVSYGILLNDRFKTPEAAVDKADALESSGFVSLGTGGSIVMTFDRPITDGEGYDFAVFGDSPRDNTLELAYVEVSSDGELFIRFDNESLIPGDAYGATDPSLISGLAGECREWYGTPFNLTSLSGKPEVRSGKVNLKRITHVRIIDVYGGRDKDTEGNIIYDLIYNLESSRAGFDLDAIGVINENCDPGDTDGDGEVTLKDALFVLQILAGIQGSPADICISADVNGDNKIGYEELLFVLRKVSGM